MNLILWGLLYLLGLPISVWFLSNFLSLLDQRPLYRPAIRLVASICGLLLFILLTDRALLQPLMASFTTVLGLHILSGFLFRSMFLGASHLERKSPGDKILGRGGETCHRDAYETDEPDDVDQVTSK